jgi:hypothetical protein
MKRDDLFAGYEQGQRDMLAKCIAALEADDLNAPDPDWNSTNWNNAVFECAETLRALLRNDSVPESATLRSLKK